MVARDFPTNVLIILIAFAICLGATHYAKTANAKAQYVLLSVGSLLSIATSIVVFWLVMVVTFTTTLPWGDDAPPLNISSWQYRLYEFFNQGLIPSFVVAILIVGIGGLFLVLKMIRLDTLHQKVEKIFTFSLINLAFIVVTAFTLLFLPPLQSLLSTNQQRTYPEVLPLSVLLIVYLVVFLTLQYAVDRIQFKVDA